MQDKPVILIVDDQPQDIELLEAHLVPQGYKIVKAASGEEALEKLSSNQIALILMDVLMSGMDGFEVTRRIRQDTAHRLIPIILITALQETEDRVKGIEAGCDDFLSKPLDKMELFARVRSLLQVKAYNDLMRDYQIELEAMVTSRTEELKHALENLQQEITERKRVEERLRESEERYRLLVEASNDLVWIFDLSSMSFTYCSKSVETILGYSQEKVNYFNNFKLDDIFPPETKKKVAGALDNVLKGESSSDFLIEAEHRHADGSLVWMEISAVMHRDNQDQPISFTGISRDITERKQAEEALRHRLIYEQMLSRISTMAVQYEGLERFLNDSLTILGETLDISRVYLFEYHHETDSLDNTVEWCAPEEAPQKNALQDVPAATIPWWMAVLKDGGTICFSDIEDIPDEGVKEILRPQAICSIVAVPLFVNGRFHGFMGFDECRFYREWPEEDVEILLTISRIIAGVVYKELSEEEIEQERQQLLSIFNSIEEVIYISDPETYEILYVNPKLANILQRDCVGGLCYKEFQGFDEPCAFCTNDIILKQQPQPHYWEYYNPKLEQHSFIVDRIIEWPDGRKVRFEMATDVTERKRAEGEKEKLESQLRQAQKMESVGRLAGGVAHDFNNKLTIINGYAEMAIDMMDPSDPLRETIQEIYTAGNQSALIVRQLLAFARQQTISPVLLDLNGTISSMLKMLQHLIGENIDLAWHPGNSLWPVKIDPSQVDQIIANLSVNSRDAISDVGKLNIETKNTIVDEDYCKSNPEAMPGRYVMLAISDDGCGIETEVMGQLFEPFFTTKEIGKGTGLGLPTVYGIVKQNKGFINVYSEPGEGTTFKIYLPSQEDAEKSAVQFAKESSEQIPKGTETILVVEDEPAILKMGRGMLERLGYTVLTAEKASDALRVALEYDGTIDLLITDVVMPEMNGWDLSSQLAKNHPGLKTLFMSGYTADVIAHHGVLDKGVQFIQKPFSLRDLSVKVREVIEQE